MLAGFLLITCSACFPRAVRTTSLVASVSSLISHHSRKCATRLLTDQSARGLFSIHIPSSQMTLAVSSRHKTRQDLTIAYRRRMASC